MHQLQGRGLYRQAALDHLNALDEVNVTLKVISLPLWVSLLACLLGLTSILLWLFYGTLNFQVEMQGIVLPTQSIISADNIINKNIQDRRRKLMRLKSIYEKKQDLYKRHYLTINDLAHSEQEYLAAKEEIHNPERSIYANDYPFSLSGLPLDHEDLEVLAFIHPAKGKLIKTSMQVLLLPRSRSVMNRGYIKAEVISVSAYPVTKKIAYAFLANKELVDEFFTQGPPFIARIKLASGTALQPGEWVNGKITWQQCSPVNYVYHQQCPQTPSSPAKAGDPFHYC